MVSFGSGPYWARWRMALPWGAAALAGMTLIIGLCVISSEQQTAAHMIFLDPVMGLTAMGMLIYASREGPNRLRTVLSVQPLVWIGLFSYSLYLVHFPLLQIVWQYAVHPLALKAAAEFFVLLAFGGAVSLISAFLFFRVFEFPFLNVKRRELGLTAPMGPAFYT
jgi:peptidoglycan/LPS O-acetylase OafA/YrhL